MIDVNGLFDSETRATRVRDRAAKKYGEDRVSDVYNNTSGGGKANYSFSIYGKGKTKYSRGGGTDEHGGPIITCDKSDKVVSNRKDYRDYKESFTMAGYYRGQMAKSKGVDKFGYSIKLAGENLFHADEQDIVDNLTPYLEGVAEVLPIVSEYNDGCSIFTGEDMYGNDANCLDKALIGVNVAREGYEHHTEYILKRALSKSERIITTSLKHSIKLRTFINTVHAQKGKVH